MDNYATLWEAIARTLPDHVAIVQGDSRRITWGDFDQRAGRLATALRKAGVGQDSKVALCLHNCAEYLEAVYAAFKLRAVPVNVNYRYVADEIAYVLGDAEAEALVFHASLAARVAGVPGRLTRLSTLVRVDDVPSADVGDVPSYQELVTGHAPLDPIKRSGDDRFILYTGGTTGFPKGVVWRHADLFAGLREVYEMAGVEPPTTPDGIAETAAALNRRGAGPVALPTSPLMHGSALFLAMTALLLGGTVVLPESRSLDAHEVWRLVEREGVTQLGIVGDVVAKPLVSALHEAEESGRPYDLRTLGTIASSGTIWSAPIKRALLRFVDARLVDMLGASEGGPFATAVSDRRTPPETARFTLSGRAALLRDDGTPVPPGSDEAGVLALTGPLPLGYYRDPEKTAHTFREIGGRRYAVLGDHARTEADGSVAFLGRGSLVINTGGEKIYPEEVEEVLKAHAAVVDCNVVGVPDERWGEAVAAVVALRPGQRLTPGELDEWLADRLARYKQPRQVVVVDEIQRSPAGKAKYAWARQVVLERLGQIDKPPSTGSTAPVM